MIFILGYCAVQTAVFLATLNVVLNPVFADVRLSTLDVRTTSGPIRGERVRLSYDLGPEVQVVTIRRFLGVPYAAPPVGENRFQPPKKLKDWQTVRDATRHSASCPQPPSQPPYFHPDTKTANQDEDCLYLNIFSPEMDGSADEQTPVPVMVYIHGGSFEIGAGRIYDGSVLAMYGVAVVTINYRLGALGFMTTGDDVIPGNNGLLDMVFALKWVNENIGRFGGDARRVTLFGHSAGASAVGILLTVPQTQGLFHGAIAQSGSASGRYCVRTPGDIDFHWYVKAVGEILGCGKGDLEAIVECLKKVPAQEYIKHRVNFPLYDPIDVEFRPLVDGKVIPLLPDTLFAEGRFHQVPLIVGTVANEFSNYFNGVRGEVTNYNNLMDRYLQKILGRGGLVDVVTYAYTNRTSDSDTYLQASGLDRGAILSDMNMVAPTVEMASRVSIHSSRVYQYHFESEGSFHSAELNYVFGAPFSGTPVDEIGAMGDQNQTFTEEDENLSRLVMTLWTNFAKYGLIRPMSVFDETSSNVTWDAFRPNNRTYLTLTKDNVQMRYNLRADKVALWNELLPIMQDKLCGAATPPANISVWLWVFVGSTIVLLAVVLSVTLVLVRISAKQRRYVTNSKPVNNAAGDTACYNEAKEVSRNPSPKVASGRHKLNLYT